MMQKDIKNALAFLYWLPWDIRSNKNALAMNSSHNFSSFSSERARFSAVLISLSF
jgi:hypothetical protein